MIYLIAIITVVLLALMGIATLYRYKAKVAQAEAERQRNRAESAHVAIKQRQRQDQAQTKIQEAHRHETIATTDPVHLAHRTDFATDWDGLPNYGSTADTCDSSSASSDTSCPASD